MTRGSYTAGLALVTVIAAGCTPPLESPVVADTARFIISNAVTIDDATSGHAIRSATEPKVFISLAPGSLPGGTMVTIRVDRTGAEVSAALVDGGLDPVGVPAIEGDELSLTVRASNGTVAAYRYRVPPRKPPVIVRTDPEKNKRDVPLNMVIQVILSEPIAASSLTPQDFELRSEDGAVEGTLFFANPEHTVIEFTPDTDLKPKTEYELVLRQSIRDLDGMALEAEATIRFSTGLPFVVSNPVVFGSESVVFVSLLPGAVPSGRGVTVVSLQAGDVNSAPMRDGGLDPLRARARAGNELSVGVTESSGARSWYLLTVPSEKEPMVVRTEPEAQILGVPLNQVIRVVFSEPIDVASLTSQNVELRTPAGSVSGRLSWLSTLPTAFEFIPGVDLLPSTEYVLALGSGIRDLEGTGIVPASISFTTAAGNAPAPAGQLAFVRDDQIYRVNPDGTALVQLTNTTDGVSNRDPAWSGDGQRLAFASNREGSWDIYIMNADGSGVIRRTVGGSNTEPAWSPDGRTIAFRSFENGSSGISVIEADGLAGSRVLFGGDGLPGYVGGPAWSPDGRKITFTSDRELYDTFYDLWIMNADGSDPEVLLTAVAVGDFTPFTRYSQSSWSPDGQRIAMGLEVDPYGGIAIANVDGSGLKVIVGPTYLSWAASPTWSPDGSSIAFAFHPCFACQPSLRFVAADGSAQGTVVDNGHSPAWRP